MTNQSLPLKSEIGADVLQRDLHVYYRRLEVLASNIKADIKDEGSRLGDC